MTTSNGLFQDPTVQLLEEVRAALEDQGQLDNPLHEPLARLHKLACVQRERMERLVRISDGYQLAQRQQSKDLLDQYDRNMRRLEKLARISDHYQSNLRSMMEQVRETALTDMLTGLRNRRFLMEHIHASISHAQSAQTPLCVAIMDVDHFKNINDQYGHEFGDEVLCAIAKALPCTLKAQGFYGRWGGEEFLILLPNTDLAQAQTLAESLLAALRALRFPSSPVPNDFYITASIGISQYRPNERYSEHLSRADKALYRAKNEGRNRVVLMNEP